MKFQNDSTSVIPFHSYGENFLPSVQISCNTSFTTYYWLPQLYFPPQIIVILMIIEYETIDEADNKGWKNGKQSGQERE